MAVWPGDPPFTRETVLSFACGDEVEVSRLGLSSHAGTHVDAPAHFLASGPGVDQLALEAMVGPCLVVEALEHDVLGPEDLGSQVAERILFKTKNSLSPAEPAFDPGFVALGVPLARELLRRRVRLVGVDGPSVEPFSAPGYPVHHLLLGAGVVVLEGLDLSLVGPGRYWLWCLPLKVAGADGAPARVVLVSGAETQQASSDAVPSGHRRPARRPAPGPARPGP